MIKSGLWLCMLLLFVSVLNAQTQTNCKKISAVIKDDNTVLISDSSVIIPSSVFVLKSKTEIVPSTGFQFNLKENIINFNSPYVKNGDTVLIFYKTINLNNKGIFCLYQKKMDSSAIQWKDPFIHTYYDTDRGYNENIGELHKSGNISRGFSIGNRQDLGLNSSLNLQLQGKLNDLDILASISDNNLPVQPDGTSAKLQEFDKIFVRLSKNNTSLIAGDISIQAWPDPMFLKFRRNAQGIEFSSQQKSAFLAGSLLKYRTYLSAGKGKFNRQTLTTIDGVSGPYRLYGAENEQYIIVIAGSEQVFIDGKKMNRGLDADYIIDYNTAEIRFMPKISITVHSRIIVEFEYSDKKFVRTLFGADASWNNKKTNISAGFISEGDMKNQPLQQTLSSKQKNKLFLSGDNFPIYESGIDTLSFNSDHAMYKMVDTLGYDSVLVFSTDSALATYTAVFSFVGKNKGNYRQAGYNINGRTYEWVEPVGNQKQGDYEPVSILYAPQRKIMLYALITHRINKRISFSGDYAYSDSDNNTFSPYGNYNNNGVAANIQLTFQTGKIDSAGKSKSKINLYQRFIEYTFAPIDRFESIEFDRDWNITLLKPSGNQWRRGILFLTYPDTGGQQQVQIEQLSYKKGFNAYRFLSNNQIIKKTWTFGNNFSGNMGSMGEIDFQYLKNNLKIEKKIRRIKMGILQCGEYNSIRMKNDSLIPGSLFFMQGEIFFSIGDSSKQNITVFQRGRYDEKPLSNTLCFFSRIFESGATAKLPTKKIDRLQAEILLRQSNYAMFAGQKNEKSINARIDYADSYLAKLFSSTLFLEMSNGTEAKKEYSFIEVLPGNGTHTWIDFNSNGIKELDEFTPAIYSDQANYIRVVLPGNEYIKTYLQSANGNFIIDGSRIKGSQFSARAIRLFYNRINGNFSSSLSSDNRRFLSLFSDDSTQISSSRMIRNTMIINKGSSKFNLSWDLLKGDNLNLSINGSEKRTKNKNDFKLLWNINKSLMLEPSFSTTQDKMISYWAPYSNYKIDEQTTKSILSYQRENKQRISIGIEYAEKNNQNDTSRSINRKVFGEYRLSKAGTAGITFKYTIQQISYNGRENTTASYQMLEGLKPGTNHLWNVSIQKMITKTLQIGLNYEGRAPQGSPVIHVGSIQLRAIL